jgi:uncharacterized membrane protein
MKNAVENNDARRQYYADKTRQATTAIENDLLKEQHASMPLHIDRQSSVSVGGRRVAFDD